VRARFFGRRCSGGRIQPIGETRHRVVARPPIAAAHDPQIAVPDELRRGFEIPARRRENVVDDH
jgi:hypothetical protein